MGVMVGVAVSTGGVGALTVAAEVAVAAFVATVVGFELVVVFDSWQRRITRARLDSVTRRSQRLLESETVVLCPMVTRLRRPLVIIPALPRPLQINFSKLDSNCFEILSAHDEALIVVF